MTQNPKITSLHGDSITFTIKETFGKYVLGNYHPLTILSYQMEYSVFKLSPGPYHVTNLIIHIINSILVLMFVWFLTRQKWTSFLTALLFSIHPMHVESVAWVSERKDVLYTMFSLASLCFYVLFTADSKNRMLHYFSALLLFILALLSKGMAVFIPIIFVLIDYFKGIKVNWKNLLAKLPFFLLSLVFGIIAVHAQRSANFTADTAHLSYIDRVLFSSYSMLLYLWKLLFPFNLSGFYSYPIKTNDWYPVMFYVAPFMITIIILLVIWSKKITRDILFGFGFFFFSLIMVLKLLPVGGALMADRYSYFSYIGIFFILARQIQSLVDNRNKSIETLKIPILMVVVISLFTYSFLAFNRTMIWKDSISLWTDALKHNPKNTMAHHMRGLAYYHNKEYDLAVSDINQYLSLKTDKANVFNDRGLCYIEMKRYEEALQDFTVAIRIQKDYADAYYNKGIVYNDTEQYEKAIPLYDSALMYKPEYAKAYYNRAGAYYLTGKTDKALKDALKAKELGYDVEEEFIKVLKSMQ